MRSSNRTLINIFRSLLVVLLVVNILNGAVSNNPRFSSVSSWGEFWQGLFLTVLITWAILEAANLYLKKTKVGHLPAYFWAVAAGLNGADFISNYALLFEIPYYDKLIHASSGLLVTLLVLALILQINKNYNLNLRPSITYLLVIGLVNMGGILYEIAELIGDKYFGARNITGRFDTTGDLVFNNLGMTLMLIGYWISKKIKGVKKNYNE